LKEVSDAADRRHERGMLSPPEFDDLPSGNLLPGRPNIETSLTD
jgi:hypothetical protein